MPSIRSLPVVAGCLLLLLPIGCVNTSTVDKVWLEPEQSWSLTGVTGPATMTNSGPGDVDVAVSGASPNAAWSEMTLRAGANAVRPMTAGETLTVVNRSGDLAQLWVRAARLHDGERGLLEVTRPDDTEQIPDDPR